MSVVAGDPASIFSGAAMNNRQVALHPTCQLFYATTHNDTQRHTMSGKPPKKTGSARILAAFAYSLAGLRCTFSTEAAFRQEACLVAIVSLVLFFLPLSLEWKGLLFFATAGVLVVELLNSAIESVVDLASSDYHILAKRAKDIGSAAVFVSIVLALLLWSGAVVSIIWY